MHHTTPDPDRPARDRRDRRGPLVLALLTALVLVLGACSANGGEGASDDTTTTAAGGGSTPAGSDDTTTTEGPDDATTTTEGGGSTPDDDQVSDLADGLESGFEVEDRGTAECIASAWIDIIGADRISDADADLSALGDGETTEWALLDISDTEASDLYAAIGGCDHDVVQVMADSLADEDDLTGEQVECIQGLLDDATMEEFVTMTLQGEEPSDSELVQGYAECTASGGG